MKEIKLTQGKVALVDDADYEWLNQWKWWAHKDYNTFYARRSYLLNGKTVGVKMHRLILNLTDPKIIGDHKDGNGLNNQRYNLRICTTSDNGRNRKTANGSSKFVGVSRVITKAQSGKDYQYWRGNIKPDKHSKIINLGHFKTEAEAAKAYNEAALKYFGEFASLNVI